MGPGWAPDGRPPAYGLAVDVTVGVVEGEAAPDPDPDPAADGGADGEGKCDGDAVPVGDGPAPRCWLWKLATAVFMSPSTEDQNLVVVSKVTISSLAPLKT